MVQYTYKIPLYNHCTFYIFGCNFLEEIARSNNVDVFGSCSQAGLKAAASPAGGPNPQAVCGQG